MKLLGNILWLVFGGLESALAYFSGSFFLMITIVGIPFGIQTIKLGILCLWPFGSRIESDPASFGCLSFLMNVIWFIFGGFWAFLMHVFFGLLLCITIIGIPFGIQQFKLARISLCPFGKVIVPDI